jgi:predicted transposase/invertase (TIGR01784 family)
MKSDHWFFAVFRDLPWLYFRLIGLPEGQATNYRFDAAELKEISLRLDGILRPEAPGETFFFLEAQLYKDAAFYRKWVAKILLYSHKNQIEADWRGLVLFGGRSHEPNPSYGIQEWIDSGRIRRVYLEELPDFPGASLEVAVLKLAIAKPDNLLDQARDLVTQVKATNASVQEPKKLLAIIEAFVVSNFPQLTRAEIQAMLLLNDIRESTIFQEGLQEGKLEEKMAIIALLHSKGRSIREICELLNVDEKLVKQALSLHQHNS